MEKHNLEREKHEGLLLLLFLTHSWSLLLQQLFYFLATVCRDTGHTSIAINLIYAFAAALYKYSPSGLVFVYLWGRKHGREWWDQVSTQAPSFIKCWPPVHITTAFTAIWNGERVWYTVCVYIYIHWLSLSLFPTRQLQHVPTPVFSFIVSMYLGVFFSSSSSCYKIFC